MAKRRFSSFWAIILIIAVVWFFSELGYIDFDIPWLPLILIIVALGAIINHLMGK